jgi:hypothetical protein
MLWTALETRCQRYLIDPAINYQTLLKEAEEDLCRAGFLLHSSETQDAFTDVRAYPVPTGFVAAKIIRYKGEEVHFMYEHDMVLNLSGEVYAGYPWRYYITNTDTVNLDNFPTLGATKQTITAFADNTIIAAGTVRATLVDHGYSTGDVIVILATTSYNATETITVLDDDTFYFTATWVATETGTAHIQNNNIEIVYYRVPTAIEQALTSPTIEEKYHVKLIDYCLAIAYADDKSGKGIGYQQKWDLFVEETAFHNKPRPYKRQIPLKRRPVVEGLEFNI